MKTYDLYAFLKKVKRRKEELGISYSPAEVEALRNKGSARTPEKRAFLTRIDARARAAGRKPVKSHY